MSKIMTFIFVLLLPVCLKIINAGMQGHIVDGIGTQVEQYPHSAFVAIGCVIENEEIVNTYGCGASIINQFMLLSAAHCFDECIPSRSRARASVGKTSNKKVSQGVRQIYLHEEYDADKIINDIALVMLRETLRFSANVRKVLLMRNPPTETLATVAGWGLTDEENEYRSYELRLAVQNVKPLDECTRLFGDIPPGTFCANSIKGYAAGGDSGSALVIRDFIQIGIVSYKESMVSVSNIIYTNVSMYIDWIEKHDRIMRCARNESSKDWF